MMVRNILFGIVAAAAIAGWLGGVTPAQADLVLTSAGMTAGFSLSTFVTGNDFGIDFNYPVLTAANAPDGTLLVGSDSHNGIYKFNDVDNQTLVNALSFHPTPAPSGDPVVTNVGSTVYAGVAFGGKYYQINTDGSFNSPLVLTPSITSNLGIWANPVSGHLLSSSSAGVSDIDPIALTDRTVENVSPVDGLTVSPDGKTVYIADYAINHVLGYEIAGFNNLVFDSGLIPVSSGAIDGLAVVTGSCSVAGDIVINNNDGTVGILNTITKLYSVIASGGSRGDFVSPDSNNGSLLVSQSDRLDRLGAPQGCGIGGNAVPEPGTLTMLASGLVTLMAIVRIRRRR